MRASISPNPRLQGIQYLWGMAGELITQNNAIAVVGTPFKKGNAGRPPGSTNKLTKTVKETLLEVFNELQEDPQHALKTFAMKYPRDFYQIAAKLIPAEVRATVETENVKVNFIFPEGE